MLRTRNAVIGTGVGLTALVCLVWAAIPAPVQVPLPVEATAPSANELEKQPDGLSAEDEHGVPPVISEQSPSAEPPENTFQIRPYPKDGHPSNRGDAILVRLDIDRLRSDELSREDVMKAVAVGCSFGSPRQVDPPPGVVFVPNPGRPDEYDNIIVKASANGDIVRLKDVAKLELIPAKP